jgi:signal transduction histidine kinase
MIRFRRLSLLFSNQLTLIFLACVFCGHLVFLYLFTQDFKQSRRVLHQVSIATKIDSLVIQLSTMTDDQKMSQVVKNSQDRDIKYTFTPEPTGNIQLNSPTIKQLTGVIKNHLTDFNVSIRIGSVKRAWLNVSSEVKKNFFFSAIFIISTEVLVFGAIFISAWSVRRFTRPLKKFKSAAVRLGVDLHAAPIDLYGPKVVRETAQALNQMQHKIQDLIRDRTQLLAAISHDLRTPITRMKLRLQLLDDPKVGAMCTQDLDEMNEMIGSVLDFSRYDVKKSKKSKIELVSLLRTVFDDSVDMGFNVSFETLLYRLPVMARKVELKRAVTNVIGNACRYASNVRVFLEKEGNQIRVRVSDDGPGIPDDEMPRVFEPFYRADQSRNRDTGGVGLGLAVTRDIIRSHGGTIGLQNKSPSGLVVNIVLPAAESSVE